MCIMHMFNIFGLDYQLNQKYQAKFLTFFPFFIRCTFDLCIILSTKLLKHLKSASRKHTDSNLVSTIIIEISTRRKFSPLLPPGLVGENFYSENLLSHVNDYIEHNIMATFTVLVKIYSIQYFCNTKVLGLGEIFFQRKFSAIQ